MSIKYKFSGWVWKISLLTQTHWCKRLKRFLKKYHWGGAGGRKKTCWERFHLVTVAIGTIFQLLKISVPKEDRSSKQNKTNKWRKQKDLVLENIEHLFMCMHLKSWYFLREWGQGGEMPKMWWSFLFQRPGSNVLGRRPWLSAAFSSKAHSHSMSQKSQPQFLWFLFFNQPAELHSRHLVCLSTGQPLSYLEVSYDCF